MVIESFLELRPDPRPTARTHGVDDQSPLVDDESPLDAEERDGPVSLRGRVLDAILLWRRELESDQLLATDEPTAAPET